MAGGLTAYGVNLTADPKSFIFHCPLRDSALHAETACPKQSHVQFLSVVFHPAARMEAPFQLVVVSAIGPDTRGLNHPLGGNDRDIPSRIATHASSPEGAASFWRCA